MTKQEIDNLKVGDVIEGNDKFTISEIFESKEFGNIFTFIESNSPWTSKEIETSILKIKQQPKKIPYTLETFPENALWVRKKDWNKFVKKRFDVCYDGIKFFRVGKIENLMFGEIKEDYKIGCQVIKDNKIVIEWVPFYQEVN